MIIFLFGQTIKNEVILHLSDVQKVQDAGDDLAQAHPDVARKSSAIVGKLISQKLSSKDSIGRQVLKRTG